jgi:hypothetical protein
MRKLVLLTLVALLALSSICALDFNDAETLGFKKIGMIKRKRSFGRKKCLKAWMKLKQLGKRRILKTKKLLKKCKKFKRHSKRSSIKFGKKLRKNRKYRRSKKKLNKKH